MVKEVCFTWRFACLLATSRYTDRTFMSFLSEL